jgi:hypothetical protein
VYEEKSFTFPLRYLWEDFISEETKKYAKTKELNKINALKRIELINSIKSKLTPEEVKYLREFVYTHP